MATNKYGVDMSGNPQQDDGSYNGAQPTCPDGQKWDSGSSQCVQVQTTQPIGTPQTTTPTTTPSTGAPTQPTYGGNPNDPSYINSMIQYWSTLPQADPSLTNDPNYWLNRITQTGGLNPNNTSFWQGLASGPTANYLKGSGGSSGSAMGSFLAGGPSSAPPGAYTPGNYTGAPVSFQGYGGTAPTAYQYTPIGPYNAPASSGLTENVVEGLLNNTSMSPAVVAQMKEAQKNSILGMTDQVKQQLLSSAANRGVLPGGTTQANIDSNAMQATQNLSSAYANIDIQKAIQDQTDKLNAVAASNAYGQQLLQQFLGPKSLQLSQQQAQAAEDARAQTEAFSEYATQEGLKEGTQNQAFQNWLASQGLNMGASSQAFQQWLASQNLNLDWSKWNTMGPLSVAQFLGS